MPSLHVVLIWFLAVMFGGSLITLGVLYCTRDVGQRAAGRRPSLEERQATLDKWNRVARTAQRHMEENRERLARQASWRDASPEDVATLSTALIEASVRRVYADIEARQVRQLAQTAWRTWQG